MGMTGRHQQVDRRITEVLSADDLVAQCEPGTRPSRRCMRQPRGGDRACGDSCMWRLIAPTGRLPLELPCCRHCELRIQWTRARWSESHTCAVVTVARARTLTRTPITALRPRRSAGLAMRLRWMHVVVCCMTIYTLRDSSMLHDTCTLQAAAAHAPKSGGSCSACTRTRSSDNTASMDGCTQHATAAHAQVERDEPIVQRFDLPGDERHPRGLLLGVGRTHTQ